MGSIFGLSLFSLLLLQPQFYSCTYMDSFLQLHRCLCTSVRHKRDLKSSTGSPKSRPAFASYLKSILWEVVYQAAIATAHFEQPKPACLLEYGNMDIEKVNTSCSWGKEGILLLFLCIPLCFVAWHWAQNNINMSHQQRKKMTVNSTSWARRRKEKN